MAKPFKNLVDKMSPEAQQCVHAQTQALLLDLSLQDLRQHCTELTQADVAELLHITQAYLSKFERRGDMLLSTLYAYVTALGGELEIRAKLPGADEVRVTQFEHLVHLTELTAKRPNRAAG